MSDPVPEWQQVMRGCDRWLGARRPVTAADRLREAAAALDAGAWPDHYGSGEVLLHAGPLHLGPPSRQPRRHRWDRAHSLCRPLLSVCPDRYPS